MTSSSTLHLLQRDTLSSLIQWNTFSMPRKRRGESNNWKSSFVKFVRVTNQGQSFIFKSKWWVTIGRLWLRNVWNMLRSVNHVDSIQTLYTNPLSHSILQLRRGHLMHGDWMWLDPLLLNPLADMFTYWQWQIIFLSGQKLCHLKKWKKKNMVNFIWSKIIYWHWVSRYIITDNGKPFYNKLMNSLYERFGFKHHNSSMYNAPANGLIEAFNKTLYNLLKKIVDKSKRDWHERV